MGTRERREREKSGMRERILSAARALFGEKGYEAVTMREIADQIEYSPTAIYHHFANKQDLVDCLCEMDFAELGRHFAQAGQIADPVARIQQIGLLYLDFASRHPQHYRFMFMTSMPPTTHLKAEARKDDPEQHAYAMLKVTCQQAIDQGVLRPEFKDADEMAQILWAALHGLISLRITKQDEPWVPWRDLESSARQAMDMLFNGFLKERRAVV